MLNSIDRIEEVYCEKLSVGNRGLVGVLDLAVDDFDSDELLSKSDQELAELTGMSERSARRLKKIVQIYNEQNWIVSNLLFGLVFYYAVQYSLGVSTNVEVTLFNTR